MLVVEDNVVNQRVAQGLLRRLGHAVTVASDGESALALVASARFDLILMDCLMPGMDGFEVTRRIRANEAGGRRTPIVALTANVLPQDRERCIDSGMDDHLAKPIRTQELEAMLAKWIPAQTARSVPTSS